MEELLVFLIDLPFIKKEKGAEGKESATAEAVSEKKGAGAGGAAGEKDVCEIREDDLAEHRLRADLYKAILLRYQEMIEQHESKSVAELKGMIRPDDRAIAGIRESIALSCHPYTYEERFLDASRMALERVCALKTVRLPIEFWLSQDFGEMLSLGAGDEMDKAIMLCSLLRSLGSESAAVLVTGSRKPYVIFEYGGKAAAVDIEACREIDAPTREEVLKKLSENNSLLYAFSDKVYEEYGEL